MSAPVIEQQQAPPPPRPRRRRWIWVVVGVVVGLIGMFALVTGLALVLFHARESRPVPTFVSLAKHPDPSLHGTVAYTAGPSRCIRLVAAAGQPSKDVLCLGPLQLDPAKALAEGKEMPSPQLVWRADGRLEITGIRMQVGPETKGKQPAFTAAWQKLVDVRTGKVEDVPPAALPSGPNLTTRSTVTPGGQRVSTTGNQSTGQFKVMLTDTNGTRTLLSVHGPGEYTYDLYSFWAPNWQWIAADDGRILVITTGRPSVTRVLVDSSGGGGEWPAFAVTAADILTPSK